MSTVNLKSLADLTASVADKSPLGKVIANRQRGVNDVCRWSSFSTGRSEEEFCYTDMVKPLNGLSALPESQVLATIDLQLNNFLRTTFFQSQRVGFTAAITHIKEVVSAICAKGWMITQISHSDQYTMVFDVTHSLNADRVARVRYYPLVATKFQWRDL